MNQSSKKRPWIWVILAAYLAFIAIVAWRIHAAKSTQTPPHVPTMTPEGKPVDSVGLGRATGDDPDNVVVGPPPLAPTPAAVSVSDMAKTLNDGASDVDADLKIIDDILIGFRTTVKEGNPVGTNREITRVLTGRNKFRLAWIDPAHSAINDEGELCDRWGTPYFFHQLSAYAMGIRSAGPDREMYSEDDVVREPAVPGRPGVPGGPARP